MKKIVLFIITLLPFMAMAQTPETFLIKSKIGNLNAPSRAYLIYKVGANQVIDSAIITTGNFEFSGQIMNPSNAVLVIDHKGIGFEKLDSTADILNFYIDKGEFSLSSPDSASKAQITGSKINDDDKNLKAQLNPIKDKAQKLMSEKRAATGALNTPEFRSALQGKYKALQAEQKTTIKKFILGNPDSFLSLMALYTVDGPSPDPFELDTLYNSLSTGLKSTETAKIFKSSLETLKHTAPGTMAPDFTQADVNGVPVKLSSFRGKYVLIDFWASWCGPCREENPNVVKAFNKYKEKNFTVLGVSLDKQSGRADWLAAIKNDGLNWTQVSDLKFWNNEAAALYYVSSIPANFLIDPKGKIIAKDLRGDDLDNKLKEVLGK
ncbi:TlpA disulfide reductase family protein [Mucilaginibacter sp. OK098]|uniref:TlpA disulfide reductase family protein n=1 Tax=Mucilaginibacter sp. OK098 TaxID=1855297 RepID=UPI00091061F2|nr:TlpA disulfide reductase family protein [Mucilaginibacter sp. OK098]SHM74196.1 Peroxiredoxin [Mucilaginibacter sp. OK098]